MKKLLTVVCLSGLLSVPSVVFAEEHGGPSWYGSLRGSVGSNAAGQSGIMDAFSRFGVRGTSEVSEGLTAIFNFEHNIGPTGGLGNSGRHQYVGLSGGFGTLTIGQTNSASNSAIAGITDNSYFLGSSGATSRTAGVKYSVSVENISIQIDGVMNQGGGLSRTLSTDAAASPEDKNVDSVEIGASMGLGENGRIAYAHISHDANLKAKGTTNLIAGQYSIGGMTAYLGLSQVKTSDSASVGTEVALNNPQVTVDGSAVNLIFAKGTTKQSGTYAGIRGSAGDTGLSYTFQVRKLKNKIVHPGRADVTNGVTVTGIQGGTAQQNSSTPWLLSLSRSLGGGATVVFEHANPDSAAKSQSMLALVVGF